MRPLRWLLVFVCGASSAAPACSSFDASSTPSGLVEAGADAEAEGGVSPNDAGANSACAKDHAGADLCDDFDNGGYQPAWTADKGGAGVTLSVVSTPHVSAPFALAARNVGATPPGGASAFLRAKASTAGATEFTLEARVQSTTQSAVVGGTAPQVMTLQLGPKAFVLFQVRTEGEVAACTTAGAELGGIGVGDVPFTYGTWHHVVLRVAVGDASGDVIVSCEVDGVTRTGVQTDVIDAKAGLAVGLAVQEGQGPLTVLFDDVVFDAK